MATIKKTIEIVNGKRGFHLRVNADYICFEGKGQIDAIKAIRCGVGIPYGATEWVSVSAIRKFWAENRLFIIASLNFPYKSHWGKLIRVDNSLLNA